METLLSRTSPTGTFRSPLAATLCEQGRLDEAAALLEARLTADELSPADRADVRSLLGLVRARQGDFEAADVLLADAGAVLVAAGERQRSRQAEIRRAEAILLQGRPAEALAHLNTIDDDGPRALMLRGAALHALGARHAASEVLDRAAAAAHRAGDRLHQALVACVRGETTNLAAVGLRQPPAFLGGWYAPTSA